MPAEWKSHYGELVHAKSHGFERELDNAQLGAWVTLVAMFGAWFALYAYMLPFPAAAICTAIFVILGATTIVLKIFLTLSDNVDEGVYQQKAVDTAITGDPPAGKRPCYFCHRFVDKSSKHCMACGRCCFGFRHHCRWANICVGEKNYRLFFTFMCFATCSIGFMFSVGLFLLERCIGLEQQFCRARLYQVWGLSSLPAYYAIMAVFMFYQFVGFLFLMCLKTGEKTTVRTTPALSSQRTAPPSVTATQQEMSHVVVPNNKPDYKKYEEHQMNPLEQALLEKREEGGSKSISSKNVNSLHVESILRPRYSIQQQAVPVFSSPTKAPIRTAQYPPTAPQLLSPGGTDREMRLSTMSTEQRRFYDEL